MVLDPKAAPPELKVALENTFDFASAEYRVLFDASSATVFQAPFWLAGFYANLAGPLELTPVIVTIRDGGGELLAVFPCVRQSSMGVRIIQPADMGVSDYNCIIVSDDMLPALKTDREAQQNILSALEPYDVLFFRKQRSDTPRIEDILPNGSISPSDYKSHEVELGSGFETWQLNNLSANFRQTARRKVKKLNADHGGYEFRTVTDESEIRDALTFIREHRSSRYKDDILKQAAFFDFYLNLALEHACVGRVQVSVCKVGGEIAAALFGLNDRGRHCLLLTGFVPGIYDAYSIGTQSMLLLIEDRIAHNFSVLDFALGDECYKDRYGATAIDVHCTTYSRTAVGRIVAGIYERAKPLKNLLKQVNSKLH